MDNATGPLDLIIGMGAAMGQDYLIGNLTLLAFFMIFLILSLKWDFNEVLIVDSLLTTILAILLYVSNGMVAAPTIAYPAVLLFITLVFYFFTKN